MLSLYYVFIHSLTHSFNKYLKTIYYVPDIGDTSRFFFNFFLVKFTF